MVCVGDTRSEHQEFLGTCVALYEAYVGAEGPVPPEAFVRKLLDGVVLYADLELQQAIAACGGTGRDTVELDAADWGLIRTDAIQRVLDQLSARTMEDALTGLFNRRYFDHRLLQEGRRAMRAHRPLSVMMIDADEFKKLNDRFGHNAGDDALRSIAGAITGALRSTDEIASRLGGEEFAVIMPDTDIEGVSAAAERVRSAVESCQPADAAPVTVSIGAATLDPDASPVAPQEILRRADRALYEAKEAGRNLVRTFGGRPHANRGAAVSRQERDALFV